jgi:hypothetical protein
MADTPTKTKPLVLTHHHHAAIALDPDNASLKRLAWAYAFSKKGSDAEAHFKALLVDRVLKTETPTSEEAGVADDRSAISRRMQRVD